MNGEIQLIIGAMFSGKTSEMLRRIKRYKVANKKCICIKYIEDDRYSKNRISTHDLQMWDSISLSCLIPEMDRLSDFEIYGLDEGQFFPDICEFAETMANKGKIVIVAALDATFERKPFGNILNLIPLSESVVKLNAVCTNCFQNASFSYRTTKETAVKLIGSEMYQPLCRKCFFEKSNKK